MAKELVYLKYTTKKGASKYRAYKFYGDDSIINARIEDNASQYLSTLAAELPRETHKALSSIGYHLTKQLKQAVKDGGPIGQRWPKVAGIQKRTRNGGSGIELFFRKAGQDMPYGQLRNTLGYYRDALPKMRVQVGWLSLAAARRGEQLQRGFTMRATQKQRWLFSASARWDKRHESLRAGSVFPMRKESITVPGRNLVAPVYERQEQNIRPLLESKLKVYMRKQESWFASTTSNKAKKFQ